MTIEASNIPNVSLSQLRQILSTLRDISGGPIGMWGAWEAYVQALNLPAECPIFVGSAAPSGGTYGNVTLAPTQSAVYFRTGGTIDQFFNFTLDGGSNWNTIAALPIGVGDVTLARGRIIRGSAAGVGEALDLSSARAMSIGDGNDHVLVLSENIPVPDAGNFITTDTLGGLLAALIAIAGGTDQATRDFAGGTLQEPAQNATLTAALASLMLVSRLKLADICMDQTTPPTAAAGRGWVTGCAVTQNGGGNDKVNVAIGSAINHLGQYMPSASTQLVIAVNGLGGIRWDIIVVPAGGTAPVVRVGTVITTDPVLTAGDVPLARIRVPDVGGGAVVILTALIDNLRQTEGIDPTKIMTGYPAEYLTGNPVTCVPAAGTAPLMKFSVNTLTPAAGGAYNVNSIAFLEDDCWAWAVIDNVANPATFQDFAVGGGNVRTTGAASFTLAAVEDAALIMRKGANYFAFPFCIQAGYPPTLALPVNQIYIGDAGGHAAPVAMGGEGGIVAAGTFTAKHPTLLPFAIFGPWAVDAVGQGGLVGGVGAATVQANTFAVVYDDGTGLYMTLNLSSTMAGGLYTANFQCYPDAEAVNDAVYFGAAAKFADLYFTNTTPGVYANDSVVWEYYSSAGGGTWVALPVAGAAGEGYDMTDTTAYNGLRPFQAVGSLTFAPPDLWTTTIINGQLGYWIRSRVTAAQITTIPILTDEHAVVVSEEPWRVQHNLNVDWIRLSDQSAALHAADVHLLLWDSFSGTGRTFTFAANRRAQRITCAAWALTGNSLVSAYVIQEAGANEPTGVLAEVKVSYT
jgi:hypothetical protein